VPEKGNYEPPDVLAVFSFIDFPDVLTETKRKHIMKRKNRESKYSELPHPDILRTIREMKARNLLESELVKSIPNEINKVIRLSDEEQKELDEGRDYMRICAVTESVKHHPKLDRASAWDFLDETGF